MSLQRKAAKKDCPEKTPTESGESLFFTEMNFEGCR